MRIARGIMMQGVMAIVLKRGIRMNLLSHGVGCDLTWMLLREFGYYTDQYGEACYVIIVRASGCGSGMFERVGVGSVRSRLISLKPAIRASIV